MKKVQQYPTIKNEVLKEVQTETSKDLIIKNAEAIYKDKEKCMAILAKHQLDSQILYRRPTLDGAANARISLSAAFLDIAVRVEGGIVTISLENTAKRHHEARIIYQDKWENI